MNISYIKEFLVLAEICNYSRASKELYISQTTLFNHIKALEDDWGVSLFERSGKNIIISEYGQMFLPYSRVIVNAAECFAKDISEKKSDENRTILVGTQYRITDLARRFKSICKKYIIHTLDCHDIEESLYNDGCELAFIRNLEDPEGKYNAVPYISDSIVVVIYSSHPLAKKNHLVLDELKNQHFVIPSTLKLKEYDAINLCKQAGFVPKVVMTVLSGSEAVSAVNDEIGISLLLKKTISLETFDNVVLVDLIPKADIDYIFNKYPNVLEIQQCIVAFRKIFKEESVSLLECFIERYGESHSAPIKSFASGLRGDLDAVKNAVTSDLSNGFVEGNNNKIKAIKRMMYGRAKIDLLRVKVLFAR